MLTEERVNQLGLVCREVVDDDVNFLAARLMGHDVGEEGAKLGRGMPRGGLAQHFTSLGIESRGHREPSMPEVLKAMNPSAPASFRPRCCPNATAICCTASATTAIRSWSTNWCRTTCAACCAIFLRCHPATPSCWAGPKSCRCWYR